MFALRMTVLALIVTLCGVAWGGFTRVLPLPNSSSTWIKLDSNTIYQVTQDMTVEPWRNSSGIEVGECTVLEIKEGVTLTVRGGNAMDSTAASAAIAVGEGRSLIITGQGTLRAFGGNAGNGGKGKIRVSVMSAGLHMRDTVHLVATAVVVQVRVLGGTEAREEILVANVKQKAHVQIRI